MQLFKYLLAPAALACISLAQAQDISQTVPFDISMHFGDNILVNYDMSQTASNVTCTSEYYKVWINEFNGETTQALDLPAVIKPATTTKQIGYATDSNDNFHRFSKYRATASGSFKITTVHADVDEESPTFKLQCSYRYNDGPV